MENFEEILNNAQKRDKQAMEMLILEYMPLIDKLVASANAEINKDDLKQYLMIKFVKNTKNFKKI